MRIGTDMICLYEKYILKSFENREENDLFVTFVSNEDKDANITLVLSESTWEKMKTKQIGGAQAYAEGNITVKGDFRTIIYAGNLFKKLTT